MKENLHFIGHDFTTGSGCLSLKKESESACVWHTESPGWDKNAIKKWVNNYLNGHFLCDFLGIKSISARSKRLDFSVLCGKHCLHYKTIIERILPKLKYNLL